MDSDLTPGELRPEGPVTVLQQMPAAANSYTAAVLQARRRRRTIQPDALPDRAVRVVGYRSDVDRLAGYDRLTHFDLSGDLAPTFLHVLTMPLQLQLITDRRFPLVALGMVHVSNEMLRLRPVDVSEPLTLTSWASDLRAHPKGVTVDLIGQAQVGTELVWQGRSHYLARGVRLASGEAAEARSATSPSAADEPGSERPVGRWHLPADLGRRYAAISGDLNPIHLSPVTARAFGFKTTVAHGMWTHARSLAALGRTPDRYRLTARFRRPVLLPSTVDVYASSSTGLPRGIDVRHQGDLAVRTVLEV